MLVAPARDTDYYRNRPQPVFRADKAIRTRSRKQRKKVRVEVLIIGALLIVMATGLLLTIQATALVAKGYQLNQLKREVEEMRKGTGRLELEAFQLGSLGRIEKIATNDLGMRKPSNTEWEVIPGNVGGSRVAVAEAAKRPQENLSAETSQKPGMGTMGKMLARLFGGAGRVEASEY